MRNLLVVDWDFFFKNSLEWGDTSDPGFWLYDWGHQEGSRIHEMLWPTRAASFWRAGMELPTVTVPDDFWNRFTFTEDAVLEVSDSNMYSGVAGNDAKFDQVWLYDAHHDLFRIKTHQHLAEWVERGQISCEDWMYVHHINGAKLHWRWPKGHRAAKGMKADVPKWVGLDAKVDDGKPMSLPFDTISVCRSGSWVPPWCDEAFDAFIDACPVTDIVTHDDVSVRPWREAAEQHRDMWSRIEELQQQPLALQSNSHDQEDAS